MKNFKMITLWILGLIVFVNPIFNNSVQAGPFDEDQGVVTTSPEAYDPNREQTADAVKVGTMWVNKDSNPARSQTILAGTIRDTRTGGPVANALLVVLRPDTIPEQWMETGHDDRILAYARSNERGEYRTYHSVPTRGNLPVIVAAAGYHPMIKKFLVIEEVVEETFYSTFRLKPR